MALHDLARRAAVRPLVPVALAALALAAGVDAGARGGSPAAGDAVYPDVRSALAALARAPGCNDAVRDRAARSRRASSGVAAGAPGNVLRVAPTAPAGLGWTDAYPDLQAALAAARPGDEIWVGKGVHRPAPPGGPREASFALADGVALYGGFAGGESRREQRDPRRHATVLSGDLAGDDGPDFANRADNVYHVVIAYDGANGRLDGFTVRGGQADGPGFGPTTASADQGSGLNVYDASPAIVDCVFVDNYAQNHGALNDHGDETLVERCLFRDNRSEVLGAGLYMHNHSRTSAVRCVFQDNRTDGDGGGAYSRSQQGAELLDCVFRSNLAERGGGLYLAEASVVHVERSFFAENLGRLAGGGVYADACLPTIRSCGFAFNQAGLEVPGGSGGVGGSGGGGVWTNGGMALVDGCDFLGNVASFGGGVYCIEDAHALVVDCLFEDNVASEAGGLYTLTSPAVVLDCTFVGNVALGGTFSVGGGVSNYFSDAHVEGCVFRSNRAQLGGGGVYNEGAAPRVCRSRFEANEAFGDPTFGDEGWGGGVLEGFFTGALVDDCTFVANRARQGGATHDMAFSGARTVNCTMVANEAEEGAGVFAHALAQASWANLIVQGSGAEPVVVPPGTLVHSAVEGGFAGGGNHALDPDLERLPSPGPDGTWGRHGARGAAQDDDYGDLRLRAGSPAIDAGSNAALPPEVELDLAGNPRRVDRPEPDTGVGRVPLVDQGAYERPR